MSGRVVSLLVIALAIMFSVLPASAQSTNAPPVLVDGGKKFDPTTVPVTADADKKSLTDYLDLVAKNPGANSVLAVGANMVGTTWYFGTPTTNPSTAAEAARLALEICEFGSKGPCIILSINGQDARSPDGAWPAQPEMLVKTRGSEIDPWTIPFSSQYNRALGASIVGLPSPEVMVVSTGGGWGAATGKTILEAIDTAFANCTKAYPSNICVLYSVNGTVVMAR